MRLAFKEWAIIVDALGRGDQILILRKGGIHEGRSGFQPEHRAFLLFPTLFHQQRESVVPLAQASFDEMAPQLPGPHRVRLEYLAEVVVCHRLESLADAQRLRGQHVWSDEVIRKRFDWGKTKDIFAMAVRVFRLPQPTELPMRPAYGGCKSWVQLDTEIPITGARAVLSGEEFKAKLKTFRAAVEAAPISG